VDILYVLTDITGNPKKLENVVLKEYVEKCMEVISDYSKKKLVFLPSHKHLRAKRSVEHLLKERKTTNLIDKKFPRSSKIHVPPKQKTCSDTLLILLS